MINFLIASSLPFNGQPNSMFANFYFFYQIIGVFFLKKIDEVLIDLYIELFSSCVNFKFDEVF